MLRKTPLVRDEAYHIYNRGAHKYTVFTDDSDYWRFLSLLHLANHTGPVLLREILERKKHRGRFSGEIFSEEADKSLVDLLAYSLMPNHFHLIVKQKGDDGITKFMQKLTVSPLSSRAGRKRELPTLGIRKNFYETMATRATMTIM